MRVGGEGLKSFWGIDEEEKDSAKLNISRQGQGTPACCSGGQTAQLG